METALTRLQALMVLNALPHVGPITANRLLGACGGDPVAVLMADPAALRAVTRKTYGVPLSRPRTETVVAVAPVRVRRTPVVAVGLTAVQLVPLSDEISTS